MLASSTVSFMLGALLHAAAAGTGGETLCWTTFADGLFDDRLVLVFSVFRSLKDSWAVSPSSSSGKWFQWRC
jgi:hypothetical protein